MTNSSGNDDASSKKLITTRGILKGIGVTGGVAALGAGGIFAINEHTDYIDLASILTQFDAIDSVDEPEPPEKDPPDTQPEDTSAPRTTPWDKETLVVSIDWSDSLGDPQRRPAGLEEAAEFWNDYIEANVQFDLTLPSTPSTPTRISSSRNAAS